jgi:hypothetical protein
MKSRVRGFFSLRHFRIFSRLNWWTAGLLFLHTNFVGAGELAIEEIQLPALRINWQPARAHTQGLEVEGGNYFVTARREDVRPKRALLLRVTQTATNWDVWDITPGDIDGIAMHLDHPGGMQSDGRRLWIPIAESKPKSHSIIRVFPLQSIIPNRALESEFEFRVNDHIGAVAVAVESDLVFGANWDTESVYVWDLHGRLKRTLSSSELTLRGLGSVAGSSAGVAIQDWKSVGNRIFASGLSRDRTAAITSSQSRLISIHNFLEPDFHQSVIVLPLYKGIELAREAMAISGGAALFLPEDLGASNRIFRIALTNLASGSQ